jgi:hypothetical protein
MELELPEIVLLGLAVLTFGVIGIPFFFTYLLMVLDFLLVGLWGILDCFLHYFFCFWVVGATWYFGKWIRFWVNSQQGPSAVVVDEVSDPTADIIEEETSNTAQIYERTSELFLAKDFNFGSGPRTTISEGASLISIPKVPNYIWPNSGRGDSGCGKTGEKG